MDSGKLMLSGTLATTTTFFFPAVKFSIFTLLSGEVMSAFLSKTPFVLNTNTVALYILFSASLRVSSSP